MKKKVLSLGIITSMILLSACSSSDLNKLKQENKDLKQENKELEKQIDAAKSLLEMYANPDTSIDEDDSDIDNSTSKIFSLNESAEFNSGELVTITSIEDKPDLKLHDTNEGEHGVVVNLIVENKTSSPLDFNPQLFDLYNGDSEQARFDASTYSNNIPNSIAAGMKANVTIHFATTGAGPYTVSFGDVLWKQ